ncbi:ubiquitin-protein ligase Anaphase Promoting Complex [Purpureocillium lavendulum]|uniref:Ubiquitin-protein ligase Anaphase Promoting Complex n=1 Tax=Purpureocillium lavendulum TaxID=1247861 RepID=A0AB34FW30_9HYPO|nr:ubiquitin-protein ligase Anaphase Promoting Complex [Purpureocillium lavendulum]
MIVLPRLPAAPRKRGPDFYNRHDSPAAFSGGLVRQTHLQHPPQLQQPAPVCRAVPTVSSRIERLPSELQRMIFSHLDYQALIHLSTLNRYLHRTVQPRKMADPVDMAQFVMRAAKDFSQHRPSEKGHDYRPGNFECYICFRVRSPDHFDMLQPQAAFVDVAGRIVRGREPDPRLDRQVMLRRFCIDCGVCEGIHAPFDYTISIEDFGLVNAAKGPEADVSQQDLVDRTANGVKRTNVRFWRGHYQAAVVVAYSLFVSQTLGFCKPLLAVLSFCEELTLETFISELVSVAVQTCLEDCDIVDNNAIDPTDPSEVNALVPAVPSTVVNLPLAIITKTNPTPGFSNGLFEVRPSRIAGWGAFASRELRRGEVILREAALFVSNSARLFEQYDQLKPEVKEVALSLHANSLVKPGTPRIQAVWATNWHVFLEP